jgi:hypothetical protein
MPAFLTDADWREIVETVLELENQALGTNESYSLAQIQQAINATQDHSARRATRIAEFNAQFPYEMWDKTSDVNGFPPQYWIDSGTWDGVSDVRLVTNTATGKVTRFEPVIDTAENDDAAWRSNAADNSIVNELLGEILAYLRAL